MPDVQIKQFELAEQKPLLAFLRVAYADEPRKYDEAFWKWHYLENPYTALDDIPLWIVTSGEEIVGQLATIPVQLKAGDETRRAIWILDFVVREDFRGQGLGSRLVLAARQWCPTMITLGINEQSTAVFRKLNWAPLGAIHRYHRLIYAGEVIGEISRVAPLRALGNLVSAPARARIRQAPLKKVRSVRPIAAFDNAFDDLWQRAAPHWPCAVVREPRYLDWQFKRQPGKRFETLGLYQDERLCGYVVLFWRKPNPQDRIPKVAISDFCYVADQADEIIDQLLKTALARALEMKAGSMVIDVLDARVENQLQRLGFWRIRKSPQFMAFAEDKTDLLYAAGNWFLTRGDSDVSIFEAPNFP